MLKKVDDQFAKPEEGDALVEHCVTSVTTDRSMAEIAAGTDVWRSNRGGAKGGRQKRKPQAGPPEFRPPQLATLVDHVPTGNDWIHEYKYDGYRLLVATAGGVITYRALYVEPSSAVVVTETGTRQIPNQARVVGGALLFVGGSALALFAATRKLKR